MYDDVMKTFNINSKNINLMNIKNLILSSTIGNCFKVLNKQERIRVLLIAFILIFMGFLDLIGVGVFGVLGALTVSGIQSAKPGTRIESILNLLSISDASLQFQAAFLGFLGVSILIVKTILSVIFTRKILFFLSQRSAALSSQLISKMLSTSLLAVQSRTSQETLFAVTYGATAVTLGVIGGAVSLVSDLALLVILTSGMLVVNTTLALSMTLLFAIIALILYKFLNLEAHKLGLKGTTLSIESNEKILEVLNAYRESIVKNRRNFYSKVIGEIRLDFSDTQARLAFLPYVSKYVIEVSLILGALIIGMIQFLTQDAMRAVAILSVFLVAGSRIAPAILRVQQGVLGIKGSLGSAKPTLDLISSFDSNSEVYIQESDKTPDFSYASFVPRIEIKNLNFKYPKQVKPTLTDINLKIEPGDFIAIVGPSGAGKSTLVDIILGLLLPQSGSVKISGLSPKQAIEAWPGALSYVPQDVQIFSGSVRENIALGFPRELAEDSLVLEAFNLANLGALLGNLSNGIDTKIGERGHMFSGGERQRLGIARALFTKPKLLVLDEVTSALDGKTEEDVTREILKFRGDVTLIVIAHRLSTVRYADKIVYLDSGKILACGKFEEVRNTIPDFDYQAQLLGL